MCGRRMLSSPKLEREQVKRVLRESSVVLLHSLRCNRRISLAVREALLPGSRPDTRTAGSVYVSQSSSSLIIWQCVSGLFSSPNWQYQNSVNIRGWSFRRSILNCGWLPIRGDGKSESVNKLQAVCKDANISYRGSVTGLRVSVEPVITENKSNVYLLAEAVEILISAALCCHEALITSLYLRYPFQAFK